jgi:hypothetical protein
MSQSNPAAWGQRPTTKKVPEGANLAEIDKLVKGGQGTTARLNAEIDADLRARFKAKCAMEKREIKDVLTELIEGWMNK